MADKATAISPVNSNAADHEEKPNPVLPTYCSDAKPEKVNPRVTPTIEDADTVDGTIVGLDEHSELNPEAIVSLAPQQQRPRNHVTFAPKPVIVPYDTRARSSSKFAGTIGCRKSRSSAKLRSKLDSSRRRSKSTVKCCSPATRSISHKRESEPSIFRQIDEKQRSKYAKTVFKKSRSSSQSRCNSRPQLVSRCKLLSKSRCKSRSQLRCKSRPKLRCKSRPCLKSNSRSETMCKSQSQLTCKPNSRSKYKSRSLRKRSHHKSQPLRTARHDKLEPQSLRKRSYHHNRYSKSVSNTSNSPSNKRSKKSSSTKITNSKHDGSTSTTKINGKSCDSKKKVLDKKLAKSQLLQSQSLVKVFVKGKAAQKSNRKKLQGKLQKQKKNQEH